MGATDIYNILVARGIIDEYNLEVVTKTSFDIKPDTIYLVNMSNGKIAVECGIHLIEQNFLEVAATLGLQDNIGIFMSKAVCTKFGINYQTCCSSFYFTTNLGTEFHYYLYWYGGLYRRDMEQLGRHLPFHIRDLLPSFPQIIIDLAKIKVREDCRGRGIGTEDLQAFLDRFNSIPIVGTAGILDEMYDKLEADGTLFEYLDNLVVFYEKRGWLNVNDLFGCGETHITICNSNGSKTFEDKLRKIRNREQ